jgi:hypothetical protein
MAKDKAVEFFYLDDDHKRQDANLHSSIIDEGDHGRAAKASRAVMKRLGFSAERIDRLLKGEKK